MTDPYIGTIILYGGKTEPYNNWKFCNGQLLRVSEYSELHQVIGYTYGGGGDTFALPDLRGRTVVHPSNELRLGQNAGNANKQITADQIPAHTHTIKARIKVNSDMADSGYPVNNYPGNTGRNDKQYSDTSNNFKMASDTVSATVSNEGGNSGGINNMQPYIAVNFIIAVKGTFPPRT